MLRIMKGYDAVKASVGMTQINFIHFDLIADESLRGMISSPNKIYDNRFYFESCDNNIKR